MRGFILQPTYRIESGRPVVHLYGRLETGDPFLIRDGSDVPHFFIRARDRERARGLGAASLHPTGLRTMEGEEVLRVEVAIPSETPPLRDRLAAAGVQPFEADVRFAMRYLIDRGIKGAVEIQGEPKEVHPGSGPSPEARTAGQAATGAARGGSRGAHHEPGGADPEGPQGGGAGLAGESPRGRRAPPPLVVFEAPRLAPSDWAPKLRVLSLDIETDPRGQKVFSVALDAADHFEVIYVTPRSGRAPAPAPAELTATACATESEMIDLLCARVADLDPDVLTGWNVVDFDLRVLEAAARRTGRPLRLGRTGESTRIRVEEGVRRTSRAEVAGRIVLDGIDLLRGAFVRLEDYRLETAARTLLGKGKLIASRDRGEEIERLYHEDLEAFLAYNANDARLVTEILGKTGVVDLAVKRSLLTGMPPDRVSASIASFDSLYLPELRRRGFVAPSVGGVEAVEATAGGAVLEPVTGLHENVLVFDFRSLYPSLIRTFNIDPLGLIREAPHTPIEPPSTVGSRSGHRASGAVRPGEPAWIEAPNGARFGREPGILPALLDRLSSERAAARARGDAIASQAIKILMNSCYGVLATPACRFYSAAVANAITHFGQETLHWTKGRAEAQGYAVLYGDTDSLFVSAGTDDEAEARRRGEHLVSRLNRDLSEHVREAHGVVSRLELEMQCLYRRLFLPSLRHGTAGARKRYAGLVVEGGKESIHFTGMEMVRRDWTELSKIFQRGLFERVFHREDPGPWIREFIEDLRGGAHDGHLLYRKALRKPISEYTATTPPHVKAAKVLGARPGQIIDYVMTVNGPEPASARTGSFDYAHYVDRQIRPVAEAVLTHLGLDFDDLAGTDDGAGRQLELFG